MKFVRVGVLAMLLFLALVATAAGSTGLALVLFVASLVFALAELGRWLNRRFNPVERRFEDQKRELTAARAAAMKAREADRLRARAEREDDRLTREDDRLTREEDGLSARQNVLESRHGALMALVASVELSDVGRHQEALAATEEAVAVLRRLGDAQPDAFLPDLAMSLDKQSRALAGLGRHEEAQAASDEATAIRRRLRPT